MLLRHRIFGPVQAVEHQLSEKRETGLAAGVKCMFPLPVDPEDMVPVPPAADIEILAQLDIPIGAEDEGPAVPP